MNTSYCKLIIKDEVNLKIEDLPAEIRRKISNKLKFQLPYARHTPRYKLGTWDGTTAFFSVAGAGYVNHLGTILEVLAANKWDIGEVEDHRSHSVYEFSPIQADFWTVMGKVWPSGHRLAGENIILASHQVAAINNYLLNTQSMQEICTGAGKTMITATLSKQCEKYGSTIIIVPNKSLVVQTEEDFVNLGMDVGVYFGDRKEIGHTHTIITWQSIAALEKSDKVTLAKLVHGVVCVQVDECHSAKGNVLHAALVKLFKNCPIRWGMTGTIPKEDINFHQLLTAIGPIVGHVKAYDLQEVGILSSCKINVIQMTDNVFYNTYHDEYKYLTENKERIEAIAEMIKQISKSGNTLVLIDRIATGEMLLDLIPESLFVSGDVKLKSRKTMYSDVNSGDNQVLVATYGTSAVGINIPRLFNLVIVEAGKSFVRVIQSIGRGVRVAEDKNHIEVYDICSDSKFSKKHLSERKKHYNEAKYPYKITKVDWLKK